MTAAEMAYERRGTTPSVSDAFLRAYCRETFERMAYSWHVAAKTPRPHLVRWKLVGWDSRFVLLERADDFSWSEPQGYRKRISRNSFLFMLRNGYEPTTARST
jgi:hypothetical protein